jgi:hypothetical protein
MRDLNQGQTLFKLDSFELVAPGGNTHKQVWICSRPPIARDPPRCWTDHAPPSRLNHWTLIAHDAARIIAGRPHRSFWEPPPCPDEGRLAGGTASALNASRSVALENSTRVHGLIRAGYVDRPRGLGCAYSSPRPSYHSAASQMSVPTDAFLRIRWRQIQEQPLRPSCDEHESEGSVILSLPALRCPQH